MLIGVFGTIVSQIMFGLSTQYWMLLASRTLAGLLTSAMLPTAMAYISDSTSQEDRGAGMGLWGGAMGLGMVLGPGLGGVLAKISLSTPFFFAAGLSAIVLAFVYFVLPESLPAEKRKLGATRFRGPQLGQMWKALTGPLGFLLLLVFVVDFGMTNFEGIYALYAAERYGYTTSQVGLILTCVGLTSTVIQMALTGPATRRFGENRVIQVCLIASAIGFLVMVVAQSFVGVLLTTCLFILGNTMLKPALASLFSKRAAGGQGMAMGLNNSFMSLGRIVGPLWAGQALDIQLTLPFYSGAAVMAVGFFATLFWLDHGPVGQPAETPVEG
jgi:DHA1 family multidrug resistance protein-like MFS transporter